jgi:predicted component of type VI protein secretion system
LEDCSEGIVEEKLVNVLGHIYSQVKWRRMRRHRPLDVFEHRLEYAKYEQDIPSVIQRLSNTLGLQGVSVPLEDLEHLRRCEQQALDILRRWTKMLALKASIRAKEIWGEKK